MYHNDKMKRYNLKITCTLRYMRKGGGERQQPPSKRKAKKIENRAKNKAAATRTPHNLSIESVIY